MPLLAAVVEAGSKAGEEAGAVLTDPDRIQRGHYAAFLASRRARKADSKNTDGAAGRVQPE